MSFPKHPSYKHTGVELLGEVPKHWELKRFKQVLKERNERSEFGEERLLSVSSYTGVSPRDEIIVDGEHLSRAESLEGYKLCYENDLVMNIMLAWNRGLAFTVYDGIVSPSYCVFTIADDSDPKFLDYLVRSNEYTLYFEAYSSGVIKSRLRLYPDTFGQLVCGMPPLDEQKAISSFLDVETSKIDGLVSEQRRLIELLKEKRQAVISHAVTKGLNPNAPMKPSGIQWLGDVPQHWEVVKFGQLCNVVRGGSPRPAGDPTLFNGDFSPWVTVSEITKDDEIDLTETLTFLTEKGSQESRLFNAGTLLLTNSGGSLGVPKILQIEANANDGVLGFLDLELNHHFAYFYLTTLTEYLRGIVKKTGGSTQINLNTHLIKQLAVPVPPKDEAEQIVGLIFESRDKFRTLQAEAERAIELLQERRTALISAAVTGKIDVRRKEEHVQY